MKPRRQFCFALAGVLFSHLSAQAQFPYTGKELYPNYDIRDPENASNSSAARANIRSRASSAVRLESLRSAASRARASLAIRVPSLRLEMSRFGTPEILGTDNSSQFLTAESDRSNGDAARAFLSENAALFGLNDGAVASLVKTAEYSNPAGNMSWVEFRQEINGIPVFQGQIRAGFTANGALARTTGNVTPALDSSALSTTPMLGPAEAAARAAAAIGRRIAPVQLGEDLSMRTGNVRVLEAGPFMRPVRTDLVYFPLEPGVAALAYSMILWETPHAYYVIVDATDGTLLWRKDITSHQTQTATYRVYLDDSPSPLSPSNILPGAGTQPPGISRSTVTLIGNEAPNTFNNLGWITDGGNTTSGNNVDCGLDFASPGGIDPSGRAVGSPSRVFNYSYNPPPLGMDAPSGTNYRNGSVTNLFYWSNIFHDRLYLSGFNEQAGNFQNNNFGRGGLGSDAVSAQVQDSSGLNNANFATPPDGQPGVMQMYLWTAPSPDRDGSLDADIFLHELGHGVSNRLHSNASGLTTRESDGMGEGWSDFYARVLLASAGEDIGGVFPPVAYTTYLYNGGLTDNYYYGIRRLPYVLKSTLGLNGKPHNPVTYGDLDFAQINALNDAAYPPSTAVPLTANQIHNIGQMWCMALLEVRALLVNRLGYNAGNQRALQLVTDGMKLDPTSPTMVQGRDAIIAADNAGFGGADVPDIRTAFACRGLGAGASVTGSTQLTVVESFYPSSAPTTITFSDSLGNNNGVAEPGEDLVFTIPLKNLLASVDNNVGAVLKNYGANYGNIPASATVTRTFNYHVPSNTACGAKLQIPFTVTSSNGTAAIMVPLQIGAAVPTTSFSQTFDAATPPALPTGWTTTTSGVAGSAWTTVSSPIIDSSKSAFGPTVDDPSDSSLVSPVIALGTNQQLSFKHRFGFETAFDGGVLEIKIGAGSFTDIIAAGGSFVQGGYGATMSASATGNPLVNRNAWSGTISTTSTVVVNLPPAAAGQNVQLRWRLGCDNGTTGAGWNVDTVKIFSTAYNCTSIDTDGDGIPNGWETAHSLDPNNPIDGGQDLDGDGLTNRDEYIAGTDPANQGSALRILSISQDAGSGAVLAFPSVNEKVYRLEFTDDLMDPDGWMILQDNVIGTGGDISINDPGAAGQLLRFYRIVTEL